MARNHKHIPGKKRRSKTDFECINRAIEDYKKGGMSIREAADRHGLKKSVLGRYINGKTQASPGHPKALPADLEESIAKCLLVLSDWNMAISKLELRMFIKQLLDSKSMVIKEFDRNKPGHDWIARFMRDHHELSERLAQNIKSVRHNLSAESMMMYFDLLEVSLAGVDPHNIVNYDETNLADDPKGKKLIYRRGVKYPTREMNFTKSSTSIMMAGTAAGSLLPPYVIYKSKHLYHGWTMGGPRGTSYNRSKSGWMEAAVFEDWFINHYLPWMTENAVPGPKVLIGDNLSSHLTAKVIQMAEANDIRFVFLPPNSTHCCQPLDVAFFGPLKKYWRQLLAEWKEANLQLSTVPKENFPGLLKKLWFKLLPTAPVNLQSGFKKCGIYPINREEVLVYFQPRGQDTGAGDQVENNLVKWLKEQKQEKQRLHETTRKNRGKKYFLPAGKSITSADIVAAEAEVVKAKADKSTNKKGKSTSKTAAGGKRKSPGTGTSNDTEVDGPQPGTSVGGETSQASGKAKKKPKTANRRSRKDWSSDEDSSNRDSSYESIFKSDATFSGSENESNDEASDVDDPGPVEGSTSNTTRPDAPTGEDLVKEYVLVDFSENHNGSRRYIGNVRDFVSSDELYGRSMMPVSREKNEAIWVWPEEPDIAAFAESSIIKVLHPPVKLSRDRWKFVL